MKAIFTALCVLTPVLLSAYTYREARLVAYQEQKPLVIAFTSNDHCKWSREFTDKVLTLGKLEKGLSDLAVMTTVDLKAGDLLMKESLEGESLRNKYGVSELPTLIFLDREENEIFRVGYEMQDCNHFLAEVREKTALYQEYVSLKEQNQELFLYERLKQMYKIAQKLNNGALQDELIRKGQSAGTDAFFLIEKYGKLLKKPSENRAEVKQVKRQIHRRLGEKQRRSVAFQLAMMEFHAETKVQKKGKSKKDEPIRPLITYLQNHGSVDRENVWKAEDHIADFYFIHGKYQEALAFAKASLSNAPISKKEQLKEKKLYIESRCPKVEK